MRTFQLLFATIFATAASARIIAADKAPYHLSSFNKRAVSLDFNEDVIKLGAESAIHKRVAKHIRPDYTTARKQRRAVPSDDGSDRPQPIQGDKGATFLSDSNTAIDRQNPSYLTPPKTNAGVIPNLKWSFSLSQTRLLKGGWVREQTVTDLPVSTEFASAELRLAPYAYRELHWHRVAEWAYVINGTVRITGNDENGGNAVADVKAGDLWAFPRGDPHSLQAGPEGAEVLLVFDSGDFDDQGTTFMVDDWITHTPPEILAENFGVNASVFANVTNPDPYIVPADSWTSLEEAQQAVSSNPAGETKTPFFYELSKVEPTYPPGGGGWLKIIDLTKFPASNTLASAVLHLDPYALRELHWHKNTEWGYIISGRGKATAFAGDATARTFNLQAGDSWVFPPGMAHYIANVGDEPLVFLELFRGPTFGADTKFDDFSLAQWLALNPPEFVARQMNVSIDFVKQLKKEQQLLVKPLKN
ncbi:hypothetical protein V8E36_007040 [Tilletia maclaganii]